MRPVGCEACGYRGYKGRVVVSQVFTTNEEMADVIARGRARRELMGLATTQGMRSLAASALGRLRAGLSTAEEAERTLGRQIWGELARELGVPPLQGTAVARSGATVFEDARRVLLLAHHASRRQTLQRVISRAGYAVDAAEGLQDAHEMLTQGAHYGLVVIEMQDMAPELLQGLVEMEVRLPQGRLPNRSELLEAMLELRSRMALAALPVLVVTDESRASLLGATARRHHVLLVPRPAVDTDDVWAGLLEQAFSIHDDE